MKLKKLPLALLCTAMFSQPALADDMSDLKAQLKAMQEQMQVMQAKLDAQEAAIKEQSHETKQLKHQQASGSNDSKAINAVAHEVADSISIGGVVDVVAGRTNSDGWSGNTASDLVLDTFELGIEASAGNWVSGSILFLYEDADDDNLNIDEAFITIANSEFTPFYAAAGRLYVPFGNFESNMISDPVTLTLAETREDVAQVGFETEDGLYGSAYIFNGDGEEAKSGYSNVSSNKIDNYGINIGYVMENDDFNLDVGMGYINNIGTSDTLQDAIGDNGLCAGDGCMKDYVGGISLHAIATFGQFNLIGEYVSALDEFEANEISAVNGKKLAPKAWNIEGAYNFQIAGKDTIFALAYQETEDMYFDTESTDFLESAWLASISVGIIDNTTLSAEWKHSEAYNEVEDILSDYDDEDLFQLKLSYVF